MADQMFISLSQKTIDRSMKVTVVGAGQVGMAVVASLLAKRVSGNIAIVDTDKEKLRGEELDILHGSVFLNDPILRASTDYRITADSVICVVAAGIRPKGKQTRIDIVQDNVRVLKAIIPKVLKYSPKCIFIIATNPCDILSYMTWKISKLPKHRVIGSGTLLDSSRFRYYISQKIGVAPRSIRAMVIGEHGESCVPVWSALSVGGVRLMDLNPKLGSDSDPERWYTLRDDVVRGGPLVRKYKGYTSWAVALSISEICDAILFNSKKIYPVSTYITGMYGITDDVYISLPAVIGRDGIIDIIKLNLMPEEIRQLQNSARLMHKVQESIKL